MKNSRFKKLIGKKSTGIIITILTFVIVFGAVFAVSNLSLAADSLPGIVDIRNDMANSDDAYKILEIVPDLSTAEFGFLVGGEEPLDVATLYDTTTKDWITWQEYLTKNTENMTTDDRMNYLNTLVANNADYISIGTASPDKPMWYQTYSEMGVTPDTAGVQVLYGGNTPVHGWLVSDDSRGTGWNAKFSLLSFSESYDNLVASATPYYVVDASKTDAEVALDEDTLRNNIYPDHYYTYTKDTSGKVFAVAETIGELKAKCEEDSAWYSHLSDYYIVKFKLLTAADHTGTAGPVVYEASDFTYLDTDAPYVIPEQPDKGHNLVKPSDNVYYTGGLYSNEMFKQYTLDLDAAEVTNYKVNVQTVTAGELNVMSRDDLITYLGTVDFIYLNAGDGIYKYEYNNANLDLDDEAVELIFEKICNEKTPCIVDAYLKEQGAIDPNLTNTRAYALACMLMQEDYRSILTDGEFDISKIAVGSSYIASWGSDVVTTNSYNYVNGNVMVINSTVNRLTNQYYGTSYSMGVVEDAYQAVYDEIELENLYRAADQTAGYESLSTAIHKSTVVRYIMNYMSTREIEKKNYINVLEIEPGDVQYRDNNNTNKGTNEISPKLVREWMGVDKSVEVNITTMTTNEFVGKIEDLNSEYDMIYIGSDVYRIPNRGESKQYETNYTDNSMDGLIYSNVGDIKSVKAQFAGQLDSDFTNSKRNWVYANINARYSGNDISADKFNHLVDYMRGTYPIVVADKLCESETAPDGNKVDDCSYLYSFLYEHLDEPNVFKLSEIEDGDNTEFKFYINRAKLSIGTKTLASEESGVVGDTAFVVPGTLLSSNDTTEGHVTYISRESDGKFYLKYKFTITNDGAVYGSSTKYTAALYLDSNSDGKFSTEYEKIPDITLIHVASGKTVGNGELVAGETYTLTRQVPETYSGILTWKVEVSQANNQYIRDNVTGYTRLYEEGRKPVTINVLHVHKDAGSYLDLESAIGNEAGTGKNEILRTLVWGGSYGGKTYTGISKDFEFHFTSISNKEFNNAYKTKKLYGNPFDLMDYDMFILGFYDSYTVVNSGGTYADISENAINGPNGIKEFIDSGKSVLFAHDTTSFAAIPDYTKVKVSGTNSNIYTGSYSCSAWAYTLNKNIRDMVGLDAYGVSLETKDEIDYSKISSGKGLSSTNASDNVLMEALKNEIQSDGHYKIGLKALAYAPKSGKKTTVGQTQGLTYSWAELWTTTSNHYRNTSSAYTTTQTAQRVNEGQITTYPYYLDEEITTASTHSQYFTLDLNADDDGDNETDLVVWYTLGGATTYKASPRDVVNNYYIYNKGNITYTGIGHSHNTTTIEEGKLFVNTMVAAYNASVKEPEVTVYESEENMTPTTIFYEYGDADNEIAFRENTQRMYFSINDTNVIRGTKTASTEYYVKLRPGVVSDSATSYTTGGNTYSIYTDDNGGKFIKLTGLKTFTATGQEIAANALQCGVVYYVDIPTSVFDIAGVDGQNVNTFMLAAKTVLQKTGSITGKVTTVTTSTTYNTVDFVHVELFPLD